MKFYKLFAITTCFCVFCSCSTTPEVKEPVEAGKPDEILELKAKVDDLNNRIFVLTEQLESLKARTLQPATKVAATPPAAASTMRPKAKKGISAEEEVVAVARGEDVPAETAAETTVAPVAGPALQTRSDHADDPIYNEYSSAYTYYQNKEYSKSLVAFFAFVEKHPNSYLTDNAYLLIGESYFQQGEYNLAIDEYKKVVQKFPNGSKAPQAMLNIAVSYKMLGDANNANRYIDGLVSKYPNAGAAQEAVGMRSK